MRSARPSETGRSYDGIQVGIGLRSLAEGRAQTVPAPLESIDRS